MKRTGLYMGVVRRLCDSRGCPNLWGMCDKHSGAAIGIRPEEGHDNACSDCGYHVCTCESKQLQASVGPQPGTLSWAVAQLRAGRKIRRRQWPRSLYLYSTPAGFSCYSVEPGVPVGLKYFEGWELYDPAEAW